MEKKQCPKCGKTMNLVPSGVSKRTGKHYSAFWSCTRECNTTAPHTEPEPVIQLNPDYPGTETYHTNEVAPPCLQPERDKMNETTADQIIIEKLEKIEERLDKMSDWIINNVK